MLTEWFVFPWLLLLLPALLLLPKRRRWWVRWLTLSCLVVALAQPISERPGEKVAVLIDVSDSLGWRAIEAAEQLSIRTGEDQQLFYFASDVMRLEGLERIPEILDTRQTDIARALQVASASGANRALLISDGAESVGQAMLALPDFPVDTLYVPSLPNARLLELIAPEEIAEGERLELIAVVESDLPTELLLYPSVGQLELEPIVRTIPAGRSAIPFYTQVTAVESVRVSASIEVDFEQPTTDDTQSIDVTIRDRAPVLIINDAQLAELLRTQGIDVLEGGPELISDSLPYSAVVLREGAASFTTRQLEYLESYVNNGGGLMMTGGEASFGLGGWYRTPVEAVLPVNTDLRTEVELPLVAMVMVLDRSQSMTAGRPTRLELAKEGAINVVDLAFDDDLLGLIVFSDAATTDWVFPLTSANERGKREMVSSILAIEAQGGTILRPGYERAINALAEAEAALKHIIILTDGMLYDGSSAFGGGNPVNFPAISAAARQRGITTSTISIGEGADFERMRRIAIAGGGRFHESLDASSLPQFFANEALIAARSILRDESLVPRLRAHPLLPDGLSSAPQLDAYIATSLKPTAEMLLEGERREPILAVTRQGLGRSAALTTDLASWAGDLGRWEAWPGLLGSVVRWLQTQPARFAVTVRPEGSQLHVIVDAVQAGSYLNDQQLELQFAGMNWPFDQTAPGRYEVLVPNQVDGGALLVVSDTEVVARSTVRRQNTEFDTAAGQELLASLALRTGGQQVQIAGVYEPQTSRIRWGLWFLPAFAAVVFFLLELLLRRFAPEGLGRGPAVSRA